MSKHNTLKTQGMQNIPLDAYPNPQFKRNSYYSLNGLWQYQITKDFNDLKEFKDEIMVPFPLESSASLVEKSLKKGQKIVYKKCFKLSNAFLKQKTFIHFMGVDQSYHIILNGHPYPEVTPLNMETVIDISDKIKLENELIVVVTDDLNPLYPLGKQSKKPKGIFYTPTSGIYYPVWLESMDENYIESLAINTTLTSVTLNIQTSANFVNIKIKALNEIIIETKTNDKNPTFEIPNPILWSPDNPFLYDIELATDTDLITSYFGLREIQMIDGFIYLNNQKIFLNGVLDQGYYPEGIMSPIAYDQYEFDILAMKELGFNTLRKHIKLELPYFYYLCDKNGMIVFQDFINNGKYHFWRNTALPTLGKIVKDDTNDNKNPELRANFIKAGEQMIKALNNHPSIIGYTIFNESWGQFDSYNVYKYFKTKYPQLLFDTASGWYHGAPTDFNSYHWYFKNLDQLAYMKRPIFLSEFGALCFKVKKHCYGDRHVFGYRYFDTIDDAEEAFIKLYEEKIIPYKNKLVGTIYTQLSDVEEEDNGLLTYDRKILKFNKEKIQKVLKKLN